MPPGADANTWSTRNATDVIARSPARPGSHDALVAEHGELLGGQAQLASQDLVVGRAEREPRVADPSRRDGKPRLDVLHREHPGAVRDVDDRSAFAIVRVRQELRRV